MSIAAFTNLAAVKPEPVQWLWEGRVPLGKVTILEGEPGVGKSTLALELAARVSRGAEMPPSKEDHGGPAGSVLIFSGDDDLADTVRPRLEAAGANLSRVWSAPGEIDEAAAAQLKPSLIILDPLSSYLGIASGRSAAEVMRQLGRLARSTGAAIIAVQGIGHDHDETDPEFHATPRSVLRLTPVGHGGRRLALAKSNLRNVPDVHPLVYYFDDEDGEVRITNWSDGR